MGKPAARVGDVHLCPLFEVGQAHGGGPVSPPGTATVLIGGRPAARLGDFATCVGPLDAIATGCPTVMIGGLMAAHLGDTCAHGGAVTMGCPTVLIDETSVGPGGLLVKRLSNGELQIGNAIFVDDDPQFQAMLINRLALVASTVSGMRVLLAIEASGKRLDIEETTDQNGYTDADDWEAATRRGLPVYDDDGNPIDPWFGPPLIGTGEGSDSTVQYNPNLTLPNAKDPANPTPADAQLFHELSHASQQMNGTDDGTPEPGWDNAEEHRAISSGSPSEADYLRERGYPWQRTDHDEHFAPNP